MLRRIKKRSKKFDMVSEFVAGDTLKISSKKYIFDSWLVKDTGYKLELWHSNKRKSKCGYHLQATINRANWFWTLQRIDRHNRYVSTFLVKRQGNLVDYVMKKYEYERNDKVG